MGSFSIWHWLVVIAVVLLLFGGRGRVSGMMGDLAKGVKAFKQGLKDEPAANEGPQPDATPKTLTSEAAKPASQPEHNGAAHS